MTTLGHCPCNAVHQLALPAYGTNTLFAAKQLALRCKVIRPTAQQTTQPAAEAQVRAHTLVQDTRGNSASLTWRCVQSWVRGATAPEVTP
jgi:hypothetical protein